MSTTLPISVGDLLRRVEAPRVEFKKTWNRGPTARQVLKTICAFANDYQNVNGGYVVFGVEAEEGMAKLPPTGLDPERLETIQAQILDTCKAITPPYQPTLSPEIVDGRHLLVVRAQPSSNRPHSIPSSGDGRHQYFVRVGPQTRIAKGHVLQQLLQMTAAVPFDDDKAVESTVEDLSATLVREFLREAEREDLLAIADDLRIYRILGLLGKVNGREVPRNVALLFFTYNPEKVFPGAYIRAAFLPDGAGGDVIDDREFRGPLHRQVQGCLQYLMTLTSHHIRKNAHGVKATTWETYPRRAVREVLVNAVLHRDYQFTRDPITIRVFPDSLEVTSYPGPAPELEPSHFRPGHQVPVPPGRNRRIGELLRRLELAEELGTGVPKIYETMAANGSPEPRFDFNPSRFTVVLSAHPGFEPPEAPREMVEAQWTREATRREKRRPPPSLHYLSEIPAPPEPYVAHPYTLLRTRGLVGRRRELSLLTDWIIRPEKLGDARLLCVVAIGGMGKSALTWHWWREILPQEMKPLRGAIWWSFYDSDASLESFLTRALAYVTGLSAAEAAREPLAERERQLLAVLDREPFAVTLDGLERILIAYAGRETLPDHDLDDRTANVVAADLGLPASAARHHLRRTADPRAGHFLRRLAQVRASRILVSSRLYPADLQTPAGGPLPGCHAVFLGGLSDEDALDLWAASGVRGSREVMLPLFHRFDSHPLLVQLLASEVASFRDAPGDFDAWRRACPDFDPFALPLVNVESHVLAVALRGLDPAARRTLHVLAGLRTAVGIETLKALLIRTSEEDADPAQKPFATLRELDATLTALEDRGLLDWDRRANRYDLHPIVRGVTLSTAPTAGTVPAPAPEGQR